MDLFLPFHEEFSYGATIWKGRITFGLVNVPVTVYKADRRADLGLKFIDSRRMARGRHLLLKHGDKL
ncbi:hypothetical protein Pla144_24360 [Bythopirellula polymerisocia]|uniref:Uncharacterized protein n=1 Tax=Bythopirellula polymerisocia TaxID=2528003 RepID=A0A5C6CYD8_9BACT|nr:hypothetical protein Pla144_24360 [Bythopirellula polymerisocia]